MMSYTMWRRPELFSVRGMLELTHELGMEGIDFVTLSDTDPRELRAMAEDLGITVACYTFFCGFNTPDAAQRLEAVDAAKREIDNALALGTKTIMVVTPGKPDQAREESRRYYVAGLGAIADDVQAAGLTLTVENFPGADSPFVTANDFFLAQHEIPSLRLTFDSGNTLMGEDPAASYARCAPFVAHAHFKDWYLTDAGQGRQGLDGRYYGSALIGEGIVDHRAVLTAMKQAGYDGFINIEYEGNEYTPADGVRKAVAYLQDLMSELA